MSSIKKHNFKVGDVVRVVPDDIVDQLHIDDRISEFDKGYLKGRNIVDLTITGILEGVNDDEQGIPHYSINVTRADGKGDTQAYRYFELEYIEPILDISGV